jgi:hypothetical protein
MTTCSQCASGWSVAAMMVGDICVACRRKDRSAPVLTGDQYARLASKVPTRHGFAATLEMPSAIAAWAPSEQWAMVLHGPNGSGKTTLGTTAFLHHAVACGKPGSEWIGAKDLAQELREVVRTDDPSPSRRLARCPVLLLDDFRAVERNDGRATAYVADELEYILTQRDNWMLPTIITMDKPVSGLGPRLGSRLSAPYAFQLLVDGPDRRKEQRVDAHGRALL